MTSHIKKFILFGMVFLIALSINLNFKQPAQTSVFPIAHASFFSKLTDKFGSFKDYYDNSKGLYDDAKQKVEDWLHIGKKDDSNTPSDESQKLNLSFDNPITQEKQPVNISLTGSDPSANNSAIFVAKPNTIFPQNGKKALCQYAANVPNEMFASKNIGSCTDGSCSEDLTLDIAQTATKDNYSIQVIGVLLKNPIENSCDPANILSMTTQQITVEKKPADPSVSTEDYGAMKGKIRISSPSSVNQGNAVVISTHFTGHQNDEFMLWITDCDGTLYPKISSSNHTARTISNNDYYHRYTWDTKAAQTKACKHTVQVKTFTKNSAGKWLWNDMAKYEITVGSRPKAEQICVMQLDDIKVDQDGKGRQVHISTQKVTVDGESVKLSWNAICDATYYIYRSDELIGTTTVTNYIDEDPPDGEIQYRIDAYIKGGPDETVMSSAKKISAKPLPQLLLRSINRVRAAAPVASSVVTVERSASNQRTTTVSNGSTKCNANQTRLGLAIPRVTTGHIELIHCVDDMKQYFSYLYSFLIVLAELCAVLMVIWGGYVYMASGGEPAKVTTAKEIIMGAIIGLLLLLSARLIISTIGVALKDSQQHLTLLQSYFRNII